MSHGFAFEFGKYKNKQVSDIIDSDPNYVNWVLHQPELETKNNELFSFLIKHDVKFDPDYNKKLQEKSDRKKEFFGFGKYKNCNIEEVFNLDRKYCEHVITLPSIIKFQSNTVLKIKSLVGAS